MENNAFLHLLLNEAHTPVLRHSVNRSLLISLKRHAGPIQSLSLTLHLPQKQLTPVTNTQFHAHSTNPLPATSNSPKWPHEVGWGSSQQQATGWKQSKISPHWSVDGTQKVNKAAFSADWEAHIRACWQAVSKWETLHTWMRWTNIAGEQFQTLAYVLFFILICQTHFYCLFA